MAAEQESNQGESLWNLMIQQVEGRAMPELAELRNTIEEALGVWVTTRGGKEPAQRYLLRQVFEQLEPCMEVETFAGNIQEEVFQRTLTNLDDPLLHRLVEASGKLLLKVERETVMPPRVAASHYLVKFTCDYAKV